MAAEHAEILEIQDIGIIDETGKQPPGCRTLQGERRDRVRNVLDLNIQAPCVLVKPSQARVRSGPPVGILLQTRDCPVIDDLAPLVAPGRIDHAAHFDLPHVPGYDPVHQFRGVRPCDPVLEQRRNVDQCGGVADGVVLMLVVRFVSAYRVITRPFPVVQALAQR